MNNKAYNGITTLEGIWHNYGMYSGTLTRVLLNYITPILFNDASQLRTNSYLKWRHTPLANPSPKPDDAGPIVRRPMGLLITSGCDTAWEQTRVCSDASSTVMQCLWPLCHTGGKVNFKVICHTSLKVSVCDKANLYFQYIQGPVGQVKQNRALDYHDLILHVVPKWPTVLY